MNNKIRDCSGALVKVAATKQNFCYVTMPVAIQGALRCDAWLLTNDNPILSLVIIVQY